MRGRVHAAPCLSALFASALGCTTDLSGLASGDGPDAGACPAGRADCDGNGANGCETDVTTDPAHCGSCEHACPSGPSGVAACSQSVCSLVCGTTFADCDGDPKTGCEVSLTTDGAHCGTCERDCQFGPCISGVCEAGDVRTGFDGPNALALDGDVLCLTAAGTVAEFDLKNPVKLFTIELDQTNPAAVACLDGAVYWSDGTENKVTRRTLAEVSSSTPGTVVLTGEPAIIRLVIYKDYLYWANKTQPGAVKRAPLANFQDVQTLWQGAGDPASFVVNDDGVYFTTFEPGEIWNVPLAGGAATQLFDGPTGAIGIAVDAEYVYWSNFPLGKIMRAPKDGTGAPVEVATVPVQGPLGVLADDAAIYWPNYTAASIMKLVEPGGASPEILTQNLSGPPAGVVLWKDQVVFANPQAGSIMHVPK